MTPDELEQMTTGQTLAPQPSSEEQVCAEPTVSEFVLSPQTFVDKSANERLRAETKRFAPKQKVNFYGLEGFKETDVMELLTGKPSEPKNGFNEFDAADKALENFINLAILESNFDKLSPEEQHSISAYFAESYRMKQAEFREQTLAVVKANWAELSGKIFAGAIRTSPEEFAEALVRRASQFIDPFVGTASFGELCEAFANFGAGAEKAALDLSIPNGLSCYTFQLGANGQVSVEQHSTDNVTMELDAAQMALAASGSGGPSDAIWRDKLYEVRKTLIESLTALAVKWDAPSHLKENIKHLEDIDAGASLFAAVEEIKVQLNMARLVQKLSHDSSKIMMEANKRNVYFVDRPLYDIIDARLREIRKINDPEILIKEAAIFEADLVKYQVAIAVWNLKQTVRDHQALVHEGLFNCDSVGQREISPMAFMDPTQALGGLDGQCYIGSEETKRSAERALKEMMQKLDRANNLVWMGGAKNINEAMQICETLADTSDDSQAKQLFAKIEKDAHSYQFRKMAVKLEIVVLAGFAGGVVGGAVNAGLRLLGASKILAAMAEVESTSLVFDTINLGANYHLFGEKVFDPQKSGLNNTLNLLHDHIMSTLMFGAFKTGGEAGKIVWNEAKLAFGGAGKVATKEAALTKTALVKSFFEKLLFESATAGGKFGMFINWDKLHHASNELIKPLLDRDVPPEQSITDITKFFIALEMSMLLHKPFMVPVQKAVLKRVIGKHIAALDLVDKKLLVLDAKRNGIRERLRFGEKVESAEIDALFRETKLLLEEKFAISAKLEGVGIVLRPEAKEESRALLAEAKKVEQTPTSTERPAEMTAAKAEPITFEPVELKPRFEVEIKERGASFEIIIGFRGGDFDVYKTNSRDIAIKTAEYARELTASGMQLSDVKFKVNKYMHELEQGAEYASRKEYTFDELITDPKIETAKAFSPKQIVEFFFEKLGNVSDLIVRNEFSWDIVLNKKGAEDHHVVVKGEEASVGSYTGSRKDLKYRFIHSHPTGSVKGPDGKNYVSWGDTLSPSLDDLRCFEAQAKKHKAAFPDSTQTRFRNGDLYYFFIVSEEGVARITYNSSPNVPDGAARFKIEFTMNKNNSDNGFDAAETLRSAETEMKNFDPNFEPKQSDVFSIADSMEAIGLDRVTAPSIGLE